MREIIFWFSSHRARNYWYDYTVKYLLNSGMKYFMRKYHNLESYIEIADLRILFKIDIEREHIGRHNLNQYWVEELFDNNFEYFFNLILKEELKDGE